MTKITFGLVVYNEERLIRRCLESIKDVADEIIVVHDGGCADRTLEIAREYTDKVYVRDRVKGSDPHRIFILRESSNDWVFMIDADELLSGGLKKFLASATLGHDFGALAFRWPLWNGERYVTKSNYRPCLFYRPKSWMIGLHNFSVQAVGQVEKVDEILEHQPELNKVSFRRFRGQFAARLDRDAERFLVQFDALEKYNAQLIPPSFREWYERYTAHPGWYAYRNFLHYFIGSFRNLWRDGYYGALVSFQAAFYQYRLAKKIAELKNKTDNK